MKLATVFQETLGLTRCFEGRQSQWTPQQMVTNTRQDGEWMRKEGCLLQDRSSPSR